MRPEAVRLLDWVSQIRQALLMVKQGANSVLVPV